MDKIDNFCLRHPKIKIQLIDASTTALIGKLESREVDFIIDASPIEMTYNNITIEPIKKLNTCFIKSVKNKKNINSIKNLLNLKLLNIFLTIFIINLQMKKYINL